MNLCAYTLGRFVSYNMMPIQDGDEKKFCIFCPVITFELIFLSGALCKVYMLYLKRTFSTALN